MRAPGLNQGTPIFGGLGSRPRGGTEGKPWEQLCFPATPRAPMPSVRVRRYFWFRCRSRSRWRSGNASSRTISGLLAHQALARMPTAPPVDVRKHSSSGGDPGLGDRVESLVAYAFRPVGPPSPSAIVRWYAYRPLGRWEGASCRPCYFDPVRVGAFARTPGSAAGRQDTLFHQSEL